MIQHRRSFPAVVSLVLMTAFGAVLTASAQGVSDSTEAKARLQKYEQHKEWRSASPFKELKWTFVGPVRPVGRVADVEAASSRPGTIFIAAAVGGVWKTTDEGETWTPIFDDYPAGCIGDIASAPSNPDIFWVGTGEANIFRSSMAGTGVYKSTDAGKTFAYMGLADTQHIARILIHPKNPDIVYVASPGHEYTFSPDRGVYKSTDGGKTWAKVFYKDEKTGVIDLAMDPSDPEILYAGTAQRLRYRWNDPIESVESGLYKSVDGGKTWKALANGLPEFWKGECERVGLDICRSNPNVVYTVINSKGAWLYRSDDKGENWKLVEGNDKIKRLFPGYGWVFGQVRVDPNHPDTVHVLGLNHMVSKDGGKTWSDVKGTHVDYHALWIDPADSSHMLVGNDGGVMISHDGMATHKHPKIPIAQMYNASVSQTKGKFHTYTNLQDLGSWRGEVDLAAGRDKISWTEWEDAPGDESGRQAVNPVNPNIIYFVTRYGGGPNIADYGQVNERSKKPPLEKSVAPDFGGVKKRSQWISPIIVSSHSPNRVLYGAQFVFLTDDGMKTWKRISPDLTNFDPAKQGNIAYSTIFALAESPLKKGLIYAGTDDGNLQVTRDEGATWTNVTAGLPQERFIAGIEASRFDEGTVYAAVNGKRSDDFATYIYKSTDYGHTWMNIAGDMPGGIANVVKEDPTNKNILYVGTDQAVYVTLDEGKSWKVLGIGLPFVHVHDIAIQTAEDLIVIATHGRGSWVLDARPVRAAAGK